MIKILPITKAREDLTNLVNRASRMLDQYVITVNGSPAAVLVSPTEYESLKETDKISKDSGLVKAIKRGEKDIREGRFVSFEELKKDLSV